MLACNKPARKPDAGNPPVRFDEGEGPFIGPSLLYSFVLVFSSMSETPAACFLHSSFTIFGNRHPTTEDEGRDI